MHSTCAVILSNLIFLKCNLEAISSNFIPIIISSHTVYWIVVCLLKEQLRYTISLVVS